jgi:hypothetical protein
LLFGDEKTGFSVRHEAKYFFRNEMSARIFWRGMPKTEGMNFYETYNRVMTNSMIRLQSSKEKTKGAGMETIT